MKKIYILTLFLVTSFCLLSTRAKCDHIWVNGTQMYVVSGKPLDKYRDITKLTEQLKDYGTQCTEDNCQFDAEWKIINHQLLLVQIHSCACNEKQQTANLAKLFGGELKNGMLKASWFTGKIWLINDNDKPLTWFCIVCPIWAHETCITVVKGMVTNIQNVVYPPAPDPNKIKTNDSLTNLIYSHIHWDELRNLNQQTGRVILGFSSDSVGRPINIRFFGNNAPIDSTWVIEVKKAIGRVKWPLYFSHGIFSYPYWSFQLKLNNEQQKAFSKKQN